VEPTLSGESGAVNIERDFAKRKSAADFFKPRKRGVIGRRSGKSSEGKNEQE